MTRTAVPYQALGGYAERISPVIAQVLDDFAGTLPARSATAQWALSQVKEYTLRPSKRMRGGLAAAAYDAKMGSQYSDEGLQLGAAIEIVQNYLLIVDDVIDRSAMRRGQPTIHRLYEQFTGSDEREADMAGILIGQLPGQMVNHVISGINQDDGRKLCVIRSLAHDLTITGLAQLDDIRQQFGVDGITKADVIQKYQQKSSYYSFVNPIVCGLVLAGADEDQVRRDAEAFGLPAGIAFQLRDDYLGVFGAASQTGKPNLDDLREGKYTLMVHLAVTGSSEADLSKFRALLGNEQADEADLKQLQALLEKYNAAGDAMSEAEEYMEQAVAAAKNAVSWDKDFGDMLAGLVEFSVRRQG